MVGFVASPGGHVDEAYEIADRFAQAEDHFWITARTPQTEALLAAEQVLWVPEVNAREGMRAARSMSCAFRILRARRPRLIVSTGAALTVAYMMAARASGVPVTYVESATRLIAPSHTGRIIERVPGTVLFHQGKDWNRRKWQRFGSVFDRYHGVPVTSRVPERALVTVGSEKFPFPRALEIAHRALPDVRVSWQTGNTPTIDADLRGDVRRWWRGDELAAEATATDVIVTHAGVGSVLMALRVGKCPVVVPRLARHGEHVDDHQSELASLLEESGLAVVVRPGDDPSAAVRTAMSREIMQRK